MTLKLRNAYMREIAEYYNNVKDIISDLEACNEHVTLSPYRFSNCLTLIEGGAFRCYYSQVERFYEEQGYVFQRRWTGNALFEKYEFELAEVICDLIHHFIDHAEM